MQISHGFHSKDWYDYLSKKVPLPKHGFEVVRRLKTGQALVFSRTPGVPSHFFNLGQDTLLMQVRQRMTQDRGQTLTHQSASTVSSTQQLTIQHRTARQSGSTHPAASAPVASTAPQLSSANSTPAKATFDAEQQAHDFIIAEVSKAGDIPMLYSTLGSAFHQQFQALPQRKQVFKRAIETLIHEGKLIREGQGGRVTIRLLPFTQHSIVTEEEACNVIIDLVRKEGRQAHFSMIRSPFHEHFSNSFSSAKRNSLFDTAIQTLVSNEELIRDGETIYLAQSDESAEYDLSSMEYSDDGKDYVL